MCHSSIGHNHEKIGPSDDLHLYQKKWFTIVMKRIASCSLLKNIK